MASSARTDPIRLKAFETIPIAPSTVTIHMSALIRIIALYSWLRFCYDIADWEINRSDSRTRLDVKGSKLLIGLRLAHGSISGRPMYWW